MILKLEGRIAEDWVALLEQECLRSLRGKKTVVLDLSAVTFIERRGVEMLKRIATKRLRIANSPPLIEDLLLDGEGHR